MLPAGLAIVVMAVVLDRMMVAVAKRDPRSRIGRSPAWSSPRSWRAPGLVAAPLLPREWPAA